ncbi:MAG: YafY family transcriptional regulator [Anaerolineae bacterium]|nr:YafY family transcriptional regulator [Anaerolineae bacterium]
MRADRLLTLLMLLQARGKMTAQKLAEELEVSIRTIYRDVDALSTTGVPVYAERGPGGGIALLDRYRTTLTGLTEDETQALFMLSIPATLADLGVSKDLRMALRKLSAALPAMRSGTEQRVRQRIHLDPTSWQPATTTPPHLQTLHQSLWDDRLVTITYRLPWDAEQTRTVQPLGLVAKAGTWHLVCRWDGDPRVIRVESIIGARLNDEMCERPMDFDLTRFWDGWCKTVQQNQPRFTATVRVKAQLCDELAHDGGRGRIELLAPADTDGWALISLTDASFAGARRRILSWGSAARVVAPEALRQSVRDFAEQIVAAYAEEE